MRYFKFASDGFTVDFQAASPVKAVVYAQDNGWLEKQPVLLRVHNSNCVYIYDVSSSTLLAQLVELPPMPGLSEREKFLEWYTEQKKKGLLWMRSGSLDPENPDTLTEEVCAEFNRMKDAPDLDDDEVLGKYNKPNIIPKPKDITYIVVDDMLYCEGLSEKLRDEVKRLSAIES